MSIGSQTEGQVADSQAQTVLRFKFSYSSRLEACPSRKEGSLVGDLKPPI